MRLGDVHQACNAGRRSGVESVGNVASGENVEVTFFYPFFPPFVSVYNEQIKQKHRPLGVGVESVCSFCSLHVHLPLWDMMSMMMKSVLHSSPYMHLRAMCQELKHERSTEYFKYAKEMELKGEI